MSEEFEVGGVGSGVADARLPSDTSRIADAIVRVYKQQYGRGPQNIKVHFTGDAVLALMRGGFTVVEESLRKAGAAEAVRDQRRAFGDMVRSDLAAAVNDVIGRQVVAVLADTAQDPDLGAIVFVLAPAPV